jgi:hypothetical protein
LVSLIISGKNQMARIYYREEKIQGVPIETPVINLKNFDFLMECPKPQLSFEFGPNKSGNYTDSFREILLCTNAQHYSTEPEGQFYIPQAIIFYDVNDFTFPSQYYFIAKIGVQLEIRSAKGGKNVKWFETPELHQYVTEKSVIIKMQNSLLSVIDFLNDYKEPEKPKAPRIKRVKLDLNTMEQFLIQLEMASEYAKRIVDMADSPSDYFDANQEQLRKHQIVDSSKNMYLLYLAAILEENKKIVTVDWKEEYQDVVYALKELSGIDFENTDGSKYKRSTAGKILFGLNQKIEAKTNKTIFCIDTDSDSYSFGLIEKDKLKELQKTGKNLKIKVYQPKE